MGIWGGWKSSTHSRRYIRFISLSLSCFYFSFTGFSLFVLFSSQQTPQQHDFMSTGSEASEARSVGKIPPKSFLSVER